MPQSTGSKTVNMEVMTEDVMNQGSIMVQMMSEQEKQLTAQDALMVL